MRCPCRKKSETITYADCCRPLHEGVTTAATAEQLMRSRYAAFALGHSAYIAATWHPSTRPADTTPQPGQEWLALRIVTASQSGDNATVEFVARSRIGGRSLTLHEVSRFVREAGRWSYLDGAIG